MDIRTILTSGLIATSSTARELGNPLKPAARQIQQLPSCDQLLPDLNTLNLAPLGNGETLEVTLRRLGTGNRNQVVTENPSNPDLDVYLKGCIEAKGNNLLITEVQGGETNLVVKGRGATERGALTVTSNEGGNLVRFEGTPFDDNVTFHTSQSTPETDAAISTGPGRDNINVLSGGSFEVIRTDFQGDVAESNIITIGTDVTEGIIISNNLDQIIRQTARPTLSPTPNPTSKPTPNPTPAPTGRPTTANPTGEPTGKPTTANPTGRPTTANPTGQPTGRPTPAPTDKPTPAPTDKPTNVPVAQPTANPTGKPTGKPTPAPTDKPTMGEIVAEPTEQQNGNTSAASGMKMPGVLFSMSAVAAVVAAASS